jgi:hypothetical protein
MNFFTNTKNAELEKENTVLKKENVELKKENVELKKENTVLKNIIMDPRFTEILSSIIITDAINKESNWLFK